MVPGGTLTSSSESGTEPSHQGGLVVLLAGAGHSTDVVANYLESRVPELVVIVEDSQSRVEMTRRRARRVGWRTAIGQVLFIILVLPALRRRGARRRDDILRAAGVDTTHRPATHRVASVNDERSVALLKSLQPDAVVVQGTRIISTRTLNALACPIFNMHAGITLRYRGVHGGYWALAERHPEWVGTTIHLVDPGIDTGGILAQTTFEVSDEDSIATYPDLHLVHGLPLLGSLIDRAMAGAGTDPLLTSMAPGSGFYYHPTLWGYVWRRWRHGVR